MSLHFCYFRSHANRRSVLQDSPDPLSTRGSLHLHGAGLLRNHVRALSCCYANVLQCRSNLSGLNAAIRQPSDRSCRNAKGVFRCANLFLVNVVGCEVELAVHVQAVD